MYLANWPVNPKGWFTVTFPIVMLAIPSLHRYTREHLSACDASSVVQCMDAQESFKCDPLVS